MAEQSNDPDDWDMTESILNERPAPLKLQVQTSRVYAEIAANEYRLGDFDAAHNAQLTAQQAYQKSFGAFANFKRRGNARPLGQNQYSYRAESKRVGALMEIIIRSTATHLPALIETVASGPRGASSNSSPSISTTKTLARPI